MFIFVSGIQLNKSLNEALGSKYFQTFVTNNNIGE